MMTNDDERGGGGKKCPKFDDVICERPLSDCKKKVKVDKVRRSRKQTCWMRIQVYKERKSYKSDRSTIALHS